MHVGSLALFERPAEGAKELVNKLENELAIEGLG